MDNQGMGSHGEPFFELLQPTTPSIAHGSGGSGSSNFQNGPRRVDSSPSYSFTNDDVLPNYDFQPLRSNGSSGGGGGVRIEEAAPKYRPTNPSFEPQVRDPPVTYEKYESTRSRHEFDKDAYDSATAAAVERTMKKYADNLLRVLEGMGGRLSQLEAATQRLEVSLEKSKSASANNHGDTDGRLRMLENMVREVQRGVQVLRDKQEINEAQFQLKLQQEKTDTPSTTKSEVQAPPVASAPPQQPAPPPPPPQVVDPSVHLQHAPPPSLVPQPTHIQPTHVQQSPHPPQQVPHGIQQQQQPSYSYPPQNPAAPPPPPPPPMQQPPPPPPQSHSQSYSHQPEAPPYPPAPVSVSHPQGPPHHSHSQAPYSLDVPAYLPPYGPPPPSSYTAPPPRQHQQQQQQQPPPPQQHGPPPPQMYEPLPGRTGSGPLALPPPPSAYQGYDAGYGGSYGRIPSGGGGGGGASGGYPHLPTAQPISQSLPTARPASRSGVDDVIDKVAAMGFPRDQVRATVQRLTENGQAVDMNVVLDKLMNGSGSEGAPKAGWFGR